MTISDRLEFDLATDALESGAFAVVAHRKPIRRAFKLFFSQTLDSGNFISNQKRKAIFDSEVAAYQIAMADADLRLLIPTFHGVRSVASIIDSSRRTQVIQYFLLNCCYEMDLLEGNAVKANETTGDKRKAIDLHRKRFYRAGIKYTDDCSVFCLPDASIKFIDFGTHDVHGACSIP